VEGAVENLIDTIRWAGLEYDEGPGIGGEFGPYIQSERSDIYREHVDILIGKKTAYRCFCTPERLDKMRKELERKKLTSKYDRTCFRLSEKEIQENLAAGKPFVVRMKVPDGTTVRFSDIIRGDVEFSTERIDDQVLLKSDGYPTYHLANVVDDHLMNISHVIRGEEWLSSTPKHVLLYQFFGWELPSLAHLPLLLNPDRSKLSKRQGDVAVEDYRKNGYLPEALVNFVALLGWNPGDDREVFTLEELIKEFSLERVGKSGAIFNLEKLNWLNFQHLRRKTSEEVLAILKGQLSVLGYEPSNFSDQYLLNVIAAMRERVTFVKDFVEKSFYFFHAPEEYESAAVGKRWKPQSPEYLKKLAADFSRLNNPRREDYETALKQTAEWLKTGNGELIHLLRLAVSGVGEGPGVYEIVYILGKDETIRRINSAIEKIK
jgi:glutamyl-tRNA synthetase